MNSTEYDRLIELSYTGGHLFMPVNQNAFDLCNQMGIGENCTVELKTSRDFNFHRCYFSLINFIWSYLPDKFRENVPQKYFYKWLQTLKGNYEVIYTFKDGQQLIEYESLSFGRMSQERFEDFIREQLPWIYENVIGKFYTGEKYDSIIETIESEYEKFLAKL